MSVSISGSDVPDAKDVSEDKCKVFEMFFKELCQKRKPPKTEILFI